MKDPVAVTKQSYERHAKEFSQRTRHKRPYWTLKRFTEQLPKGAWILDVGCGYGRDTSYFSERGFNVVGVDYSRNMLDIASSNDAETDFALMDMRALGLQDNSFDGVWCWASVYNLPKEDAAVSLREIYRVMRPESRAVFLVRSGKGEGLVKDTRYTDGRQKYIANYTLSEFRDMLEKTGFGIVRIGITRHKDKKYYSRSIPWILAVCDA